MLLSREFIHKLIILKVLILKYTFIFIAALLFAISTSAQNYFGDYDLPTYTTQKSNATMTFKNQSKYHMTVKILKLKGGLYYTVDLPPRSSETVDFYSSATYKMKIRAMVSGRASYHNGGNFYVTSTSERWSQGEITFKLVVTKTGGGSGLGPTISKKEFDSNN